MPRAALVMLLVLGCGDNRARFDAAVHQDGPALDAPSFSPPPALGVQIDRMGRPSISNALIAVFASGTARTAQKDAYNHAADPTTWRTTTLRTNVTVERELEANLAVFDAIDKGLAIPSAGCGSALTYGPPGPVAYQGAADLFADDQLYVDTSKQTCGIYLALEIEQTSGSFIHSTCGGRMLDDDVIDVTYSVLASGLAGLDQTNDFSPRIHDGAAAHPDINKDVFPYLGRPH